MARAKDRALEYTAMARDRCDGGITSLIREMAQGPSEASPAPTRMRAMNKCLKLWAKPESAVAADQTARPAPRRYLRGILSASQPRGNPMVE